MSSPLAAAIRCWRRRARRSKIISSGAAGRAQLLDAENYARVEDGQAAADDGTPVVSQAGQGEPIGTAGFQAALHQPAQARRRDAAVADAAAGQHLRHRADRARRAERFAPVAGREGPERFLEFGAGGDLRVAKGPLGEASPGKVFHRQADAADLERLGLLGTNAASDDHLGRAAADVDDEARHLRRLQPRHAGEDEARLFASGDDLDRSPEHGLRAQQEGVAVLRFTQRLRRHGAHLVRQEAFEPPGEAAQAFEAAQRRVVAEEAGGIEAGAQAHGFLQVVDAPITLAEELADLEPEAVRPHVDGGKLASASAARFLRDGAAGVHARIVAAAGCTPLPHRSGADF